MARLSHSVLANVVGIGATGLLQVAFMPLYASQIGMEAFGLIGLYLMLVGAIQIFDFGLRVTINREIARYSVLRDEDVTARDLVFTLETCCLAIALLVGLALTAGSSLIATQWIQARNLAPDVVQRAVLYIGALAALQLPLSFYLSGLLGLDRHGIANGARVAGAVAMYGGGMVVLWLASPAVTTFFVWQLIVAIAQLLITRALLWRHLPEPAHRAKFSPGLIRGVWRFAAGMSGIGIFSLVLTYADRLILSSVLTLDVFGQYVLAWTVASGLLVVIIPVFNAASPRLTALVATGDESGVRELYHHASQLIAVLCLPAAAVLCIFAGDVLLLWTRDAQTATQAAPIVSVLVAGFALNGVFHMPYALQLAYGWTRLSLVSAIVFTILLIPAIVVSSLRYGPVGAAAVWVLLNLANFFIIAPFVHRRLLKGELWHWFGDVLWPLLATSLITAGCWFLLPRPVTPLASLMTLAVTFSLAMAAAILAAPRVRAAIGSRLAFGRRA